MYKTLFLIISILIFLLINNKEYFINKKKVAICFRGKCSDSSIDSKTNNKKFYIDYKKNFKKIKENLINCNPDYEFDIYLHGWIDNDNKKNDIIKSFQPKKYVLEKQKDFSKNYEKYDNYKSLLKKTYKYLSETDPDVNFDDINFRNCFQNKFSYAYSISKVSELLSNSKQKYDLAISLRYDVDILEPIILKKINSDNFYVNKEVLHNYLHIGDFIFVSNMDNIIKLKNFYKYLSNNVYNFSDYDDWVNEQYKRLKKDFNKKTYDFVKLKGGYYSNQMIISSFVSKKINKYNCIIPSIKANIKKDN